MILLGKLYHFIQFPTVQRDRLFHKQMLAMLQCLFHKRIMCVVRAGDINNIYLFIREHVIYAVVNLVDTVCFSEFHGFFMRAIADGIQGFSYFLQS